MVYLGILLLLLFVVISGTDAFTIANCGLQFKDSLRLRHGCYSKKERNIHGLTWYHGRRHSQLDQSSGSTVLPLEQLEEEDSEDDNSSNKSRIIMIRSFNIGGVEGASGKEITLLLDGNNTNLVAVTGETGSGKSLLVSKVVDLIGGGKAKPALLHFQGDTNGATVPPSTWVEMVLILKEPHLSISLKALEKFDIDGAALLGYSEGDPPHATLTLKRTLSISPFTGRGTRMKSMCEINGLTVTLKVLRAISAPLLAVVDASAASNALSRPKSRMAMIDTPLPSEVLIWVGQLKSKYTRCRKHRKSLEIELASRTLPVSVSKSNEQDTELLRHWVDELDGFQARVSTFCKRLATGGERMTDSSLATSIYSLWTLSWMDNDDEKSAPGEEQTFSFSSALYKSLFDVCDGLKLLDDQIEAAAKAYENLASLASPNSAVLAIERTRDFLLDATAGDDGTSASSNAGNNKVLAAAEQSHHLLNQVEQALSACSKFLDDDNKGLLAALKAERRACSLSVDDVNEMINEWNTLSRKHGISPVLLPSCHAALRQELSGNVEARVLLPRAKAAEKAALTELEEASQVLSRARQDIAKRLSKSITRRLPLLGMESSSFEARIDSDYQECGFSGGLGVDGVDFMLFHNNNNEVNGKVGGTGSGDKGAGQQSSSSRGGRVDLVASSGEKARILLAIECEIPGSVRALCGSTAFGFANSEDDDDEIGAEVESTFSVPPVAVVYGKNFSSFGQTCTS
jgi:DNA repair ATPase RecN